MNEFWQKIGMVASAALPLFNIPLIIHMVRRKSSDDLSMVWLIGVWACIVLLTPAALISPDIIFRIYGITNVLFFTIVVIVALKYRFKS